MDLPSLKTDPQNQKPKWFLLDDVVGSLEKDVPVARVALEYVPTASLNATALLKAVG